MFRKPNEGIVEKEHHNQGKNQLTKKFSEVFQVLLDPGYYEGTKYAQFFNQLDEDGKSNIYVRDPYEGELEEFVYDKSNRLTYLVGLTGMGKTTLIRNYFRINDRDIKISDGTFVLYISFYYANLSMDTPYKSVEIEVERYLSRLCEKLTEMAPDIMNDKNGFYLGLYEYIYGNKPTLISNRVFTPAEEIGKEKNDNENKFEQLNRMYEDSPIEYYSSLIKYIFAKLETPYKIIFIFDDIESKHGVFSQCMIEVARHLFSCMCATTEVDCNIKVLVSMRAYTFRSNIERIAEARREVIERDTILKKKTVSLIEIFEARFNAIQKEQIRKKAIGNIQSYEVARREFWYICAQLNQIGEELIYNLSNYNLADAMLLFSRIMTNVVWIPCGERDNYGAFTLDAQNYRITKYNLLCVIAMGDHYYYNATSEFVPNIIQYDGFGSELLCLYIIRYMKNNDYVEVYGNNYIEGRDLLKQLTDIFCEPGISEQSRLQWESRFNKAIDYLYYEGILFRSLYDIENYDNSQIKRKYSSNFKLYLSPRGEMLYNLFSDNVVMMELLRDDIETDQDDNDLLTTDLTTTEVFRYLIRYLGEHFKREKTNISQALFDLDSYTSNLGSEFITAFLLKGLSRNVKAYFGVKNQDYYDLINSINELERDMNEYAMLLKERYNSNFRQVPITEAELQDYSD